MGQLGNLSPPGSVILGVFVGLVSTSVQSLGLTLQRKSHILEDEKDLQETRRPPYRRRRWQLGMLMFIISNIVGSTIQITTLPLPVLSTLQASGLVFNSICATVILGESFTRYSLGGTILVCVGAVLIAIFGAIAEPAHTLDELLNLLSRRQFVIWMIGQAVLVVAIMFGVRASKYFNPWTSNSPRLRLLRGMAYGCISGILSAHSLLVAKSAVELLIRTIVDRKNQFNRWQSWIILLGLFSLALSQLYYLHRGLRLCSTSILYPFVFCVYNIIAILDGLIYFRQTTRLSTLSSILIAFGTLILLAGVLALSWRLNADPASRTSVAQTPFSPGMGFVPSDSDSDTSTHAPTPSDEESCLLPRHSNGTTDSKHPRIGTQRPKRNIRIFSSPLPSSTTKSPLTVPRVRYVGMAEVSEIWGELEEDGLSPLHSPYSHRKSSVRSTPVGMGMHPSSAGLLDETTELLSRASMGRSYRDRRRRESVPLGDDEVIRGDTEGVGKGVMQEVLGGWWKMEWWRSKRKAAKGWEAENVGPGA